MEAYSLFCRYSLDSGKAEWRRERGNCQGYGEEGDKKTTAAIWKH